MKRFFELRGRLSRREKLLTEIAGIFLFLLIWYVIVASGFFQETILPSPEKILFSFMDLYIEDALLQNTLHSIKLNLLGYIESVAVSLPLGFLIGLIPLFRGLSERLISSLRYLPLTAAMGLFIAWFGIGTNMKVQFLSFGIIVYLLPVVIQRIDEVDDVYLHTIKTLGATKWQTIKCVYMPSVISRVSDDIRVLVAISWTYIIIAELVNKTEGGIGALAYTAARQSRVDKVFAVLIIIVLIGFVQDKLFATIDRVLFPYKRYANRV
ncbi:MAG: ABC transporter permease subunit [Candidatus Magnetoovum sp. WYHC-5]|nr:ABC transporter permease subunit [Candidatus Magnetoovum sp. WYHC-5]